MFSKFIQEGLYSRGDVYAGKGAYIRDVKWVTYLGGVYSEGLYAGGVLTGFYRICS